MRGLDRHEGRKALGFAGELGVRWWTRARFQREISTTAGRLAYLGVRPGDRVLLWAPTSPEWAAIFLAVAELGAVTVPIDVGEDATTAERLRQHIDPRLALTARPHLEPSSTREGTPWKPLHDLYRTPTAPVPRADVQPDDPAVALFTSGTTGEPRGVLLDHGNLVAQLHPFRTVRTVFHLLPFRALSLAPSSHVLGLVVGLLLPLYLGMPTLYTGSLEPYLWARVIRQQKLSVLVAVPRLLQTLRDFLLHRRTAGRTLAEELATASPWHQRRLLFWRRGQVFGRFLFRVLLVGGAELPASTVRFWRRTGLVPIQGYGLTETASFVSISRPFGPAGSLGSAVGDQELRIAPDGELLVRGPNLSARLESAEALELAPGGFLPTGDLVRLDDGALHFVGRKSEVIVTGEGWNVSPVDVESELLEEHGIRDAAAVPWRGSGGIEVHAVLVLDPGAEAASRVQRANRRLGPQRQVTGWTLWPEPELPRGRLGKLRRGEILERLEDLHESSIETPTSDPTGDPLDLATILRDPDHDRRLESLGAYLATRTERADAPPATHSSATALSDFGLSSLDRVQLLGRVEQRLGGFAGPPPLVSDETTLDELVDRLRSHHRSSAEATGQRPASRLPGGQPGYALYPPVRWLRRIVRALATLVWRQLGYRAVGRWHGRRPAPEEPFLVVAEPHRHWLDSLVIYQALPRELRRRLMVVTNRDFREVFEPDAGTPWSHRLYMAGAYYLVLPLLFCFSILCPNGRVREGLLDSARLIGKGYRPLTFPKGLVYYGRPEPIRHDPGLAWLALETGVPLLPVFLEGNFELGWKRRQTPRHMTVHFGDLIEPVPGDRPEDLIARVEAAWSAFGIEDDDSA